MLGPLRDADDLPWASTPSPSSWNGRAPRSRWAAILDEMRKLPGFPLETRSRVTVLGEVHETRSTVTRVKVGPAAAVALRGAAGLSRRAEEAAPDGVTPCDSLLAVIGNAIALLATTIVPGHHLHRELARSSCWPGRSVRPLQPDRAADRAVPLAARS